MRMTTLEDRMAIMTLARAGHTDADIAERIGWSTRTVRKWRRRGEQQGRPGLASRMGRRATGAMSTFPWVVEMVRSWRKAHPGWGPLTLRTELEGAELLRKPWPSRATIARWLKQEGLTRPYERHHDLPQPAQTAAQAPHEAWEMDARGCEMVPGVGAVALINLNDRFSKVKLLSYPCWLGAHRASRHPTTEDYQLAFRLAATEWGLSDRLHVDRDSVFYDNGSKSPFPTRFHLWLLALGVELVIGPPDCPTERGLTERSHQTWDQQVLQGQAGVTREGLVLALQHRRDFLNERLPCASLGDRPPLVAHPAARTPRRLYRPEWEADLMDLSRVYAYLAQGSWFRKASNVGVVSLGNQRYGLGKDWARKDVEITFDPNDQHLVFHTPDGNLTKHHPIKGISKTELMGELGPLVNFDHFQLALPFTWDEWRVTRLSETLLARLNET